MKRRVALLGCLLLVLLLWIIYASGRCAHEWVEADCVSAKTCSQCGETEGKALGHDWIEASCEQPKNCIRCNAVSGPVLGHQWTEATCEDAKKCIRCNKTEGAALGHDWQHADCENPETCANCGAQVGEPVGHLWRESDSRTRKYCRVCMIDAPGPLTLEQAYPEGTFRFAEGYFLMDDTDYMNMYVKALEEAGYQYWIQSEPDGEPVYTLVEMTSGNVIEVEFKYDEQYRVTTIYAHCDARTLSEEGIEDIQRALTISYNTAHGAMNESIWSELAADAVPTIINDIVYYLAVCDGLGHITLYDQPYAHYGVVSVADLNSISVFASTGE